jgi:hypothetical protein
MISRLRAVHTYVHNITDTRQQVLLDMAKPLAAIHHSNVILEELTSTRTLSPQKMCAWASHLWALLCTISAHSWEGQLGSNEDTEDQKDATLSILMHFWSPLNSQFNLCRMGGDSKLQKYISQRLENVDRLSPELYDCLNMLEKTLEESQDYEYDQDMYEEMYSDFCHTLLSQVVFFDADDDWESLGHFVEAHLDLQS